MKNNFNRSIILLSLGMAVFGGAVLFWAASVFMGRSMGHATEALRQRTMSLAWAGARMLDPVAHREVADPKDPRLADATRELQQLADNQAGLSGVEISSLRRDGANNWVAVVAPEGGALKTARPSPLAQQALQSLKVASGPVDRDGEWIEAAAPLLDSQGVAGVVQVKVPQISLDLLAANLDSLRFWLTLLGALAGGLAAAFSRQRGLRDLSSVESQLDEYLADGGGLERRLLVDPSRPTAGVVTGFNRVMDRFQQMVSSVKRGADLVSNSSLRVSLTAAEVSRMAGEVSITIQQVAKGTEEQSSRTSELNTVIQSITDSSQSNRRMADETAGASEGALEIAQTIHHLAQEATTQMERLSKDIRGTAQTIYTLGDKSERIGEVVDIIRSIADQTNLLALNAAIEAARAGDAGRGFAVVADEVRKLAEGSAESADQIAGMISQIQGSTQEAVASMQKGSEAVGEGSEVISRVAGGLNQIIDAARRTSSLAANIAASANEQVTRAALGAQRIEEINAIAEQTAASTEQVAASTEEATASMEELTATSTQLAEMARELQTLVSKFDVKAAS
jgi:methyl-accepting chemotaxis protein